MLLNCKFLTVDWWLALALAGARDTGVLTTRAFFVSRFFSAESDAAPLGAWPCRPADHHRPPLGARPSVLHFFWVSLWVPLSLSAHVSALFSSSFFFSFFFYFLFSFSLSSKKFPNRIKFYMVYAFKCVNRQMGISGVSLMLVHALVRFCAAAFPRFSSLFLSSASLLLFAFCSPSPSPISLSQPPPAPAAAAHLLSRSRKRGVHGSKGSSSCCLLPLLLLLLLLLLRLIVDVYEP
jgi:hypothetical protein